MWGVLAIYWKQLKHIGDWELLSNRIIWSFISLTAFLSLSKRNQFISIWQNKKSRYSLLTSSILIGINWGVFMYAVNANKIVQAGLGYYITPLVNVFLGITILKEKLTGIKLIAIILVFAAISFLTIQLGEFPYLSLILAFSFGLYGLIKKTSRVDSLPSLAFETSILFPFALIYQIKLFASGNNSLQYLNSKDIILLVGTGLITILPLYWFSQGAKRIALTSVGFFQYIAPSIMLIIGITYYKEPFRTNEAIAFSIIWVAILLYIYSLIKQEKKHS